MPRSSREKSEETRARIVETAYHLFLERGYNATSIREIGDRAIVTVGAIYNHFSTKEDIWLEVLKVFHPYKEILPILQSAQGTTIPEIVRDAAKKLVKELLKRSDLLNLFFIEIVEFNCKHVSTFFGTIFPGDLKLPPVIVNKRTSVREISTPVLLRSFIGLFFSYYVTSILLKDLPGMQSNETTLNQFVDLYLYGIMKDDDPSRMEFARTQKAISESMPQYPVQKTESISQQSESR
jgi:AcrR family transcriptional regulator